MSVYDRFERARHELVLVCGMSVGVSTYCCERCGALVKLQNDEVILFFVPKTSTSAEDDCQPPPALLKPRGPAHVPLKDRLEKLEQEDWTRLKAAMGD